MDRTVSAALQQAVNFVQGQAPDLLRQGMTRAQVQAHSETFAQQVFAASGVTATPTLLRAATASLAHA